MNPEAVIVCPTLDLPAAAAACKQARDLAGVSCAIVIVRDFKRRGGVKPSNAAFTAALRLAPKYIVYLNDDVRVTQKDWLKRLIEVLELKPQFGIVAPSGPCHTKPQNEGKPGMAKGYSVRKRPLVWFCAAIKRQVFEQIGLFDENLTHYGDETDFTRRAQLKGWQSVWVKDVWIDHDIKAWVADWRSEDLAYYRKKWAK